MTRDLIEAAAQLAAGEPTYQGHYRQWPWYGDGNRRAESEMVKFCDALAAQIRALRRPDAAPSRPATPSVDEVARVICNYYGACGPNSADTTISGEPYWKVYVGCAEAVLALFAKERP